MTTLSEVSFPWEQDEDDNDNNSYRLFNYQLCWPYRCAHVERVNLCYHHALVGMALYYIS